MCILNKISYLPLQNCAVEPLQMLWIGNWNLTHQDPLNTELMDDGWEHMEIGKHQIATCQHQVSYILLYLTIFVEKINHVLLTFFKIS